MQFSEITSNYLNLYCELSIEGTKLSINFSQMRIGRDSQTAAMYMMPALFLHKKNIPALWLLKPWALAEALNGEK
jgi:hypothetical protein